MKLDWKENEEYGTHEASFIGELLDVSNKVFETSNDKKYQIATVRIDGNPFQAQLYINEHTDNMQLGMPYLGRATYNPNYEGENKMFLTISHIIAGKRATAEDFGLVLDKVEEVVNEEALVGSGEIS